MALKVLFVTPSYIPFTGGAQAFQRAIAWRLIGDGDRGAILTTNAREPSDFWRPPIGINSLPPEEIMDGVQVERLPLAYPWPAPYAFGLARRAGHWLHRLGLPPGVQRPALRQLGRWMPPLPMLDQALRRWVAWADVVQGTDSSWDGLFVAAASTAEAHGKSFVAVPLMHLGDARITAHFQMAHQVAAYRTATVVVALSQREAQAYQAMGISSAHIRVVGMGIDPQLPNSPASLDPAGFRSQHHLPGPIVAFLGANTYDKGAFTLALAVAKLNRAGARVDLVCAGPEHERLNAFIYRQPAELQAILTEHVHLLGRVDEQTKHRLLSACDLLALPSQVDTFGIVLLEAWLHGKPVIGAFAGGIPDLVQPGETGLLVPFADVENLAAAIRRLLTEPGLGAKLGAAGRRMVLERYTWQQTYAAMREVYTRALARQ